LPVLRGRGGDGVAAGNGGDKPLPYGARGSARLAQLLAEDPAEGLLQRLSTALHVLETSGSGLGDLGVRS